MDRLKYFYLNLNLNLNLTRKVAEEKMMMLNEMNRALGHLCAHIG